jgi:arsenate reductase (thioredoxin)
LKGKTMPTQKLNVLVLCTGNSARSQMAEYFIKKHGANRFNAFSAGTDPKGVNPLTIAVMKEVGIDLSDARSKNLDEFLGRTQVHILVIVCGDADRKCPAVWPGVIERHFWPFEDPAAATGSEEVRLESFRRVRGQIDAKIKSWIDSLPANYVPSLRTAKA